MGGYPIKEEGEITGFEYGDESLFIPLDPLHPRIAPTHIIGYPDNKKKRSVDLERDNGQGEPDYEKGLIYRSNKGTDRPWEIIIQYDHLKFKLICQLNKDIPFSD